MAVSLYIVFQNKKYGAKLEDATFDCLETEVKKVLLKATGQSINDFELCDAADNDIGITDDDELEDFIQAFEDENDDDTGVACVKVIVDNKYLQPKTTLQRPLDVSTLNKKIHSAIITWKPPQDNNMNNLMYPHEEDNKYSDDKYNNNNNNNNNNSKYWFEIQNTESNRMIARVHTNYIKLTKLEAFKQYSFQIRTVLPSNNPNEPNNTQYSVWTRPVVFQTERRNHQRIDFLKNNPPPSPKYLQVISLYPTSCVLGWSPDDNEDRAGSDRNNLLDVEYFIHEIGSEFSRIVAHTYNTSQTKLTNLQPNKTYKFVVVSRYWDPLARQTTQNGYAMSKHSNYVMVTTPSEATNFENYAATLATPSVDSIEWDTFDICTKLRLFWNAPQKFFGKIRYHLINDNNNGDNDSKEDSDSNIIAKIDKLPVVLNLTDRHGKNGCLFESMPGKYNLSIQSFVEIPSEEVFNNRSLRIGSNNVTRFKIATGERNADISSKSSIKVLVKLHNKKSNNVNLNNTGLDNFININKYDCSISDILNKIEKLFGLDKSDMNIIGSESRFELSIERISGPNGKREIVSPEAIFTDADLSKFLLRYARDENLSVDYVVLNVIIGFNEMNSINGNNNNNNNNNNNINNNGMDNMNDINKMNIINGINSNFGNMSSRSLSQSQTPQNYGRSSSVNSNVSNTTADLNTWSRSFQ